MPNRLSWYDLPTDVSLWPGLPLSLSGDEVMPLDYRAGRSGWLLFGYHLDKAKLTIFQNQLGVAMVIVNAWSVGDYQVVRLAGALSARAIKIAQNNQLDLAELGPLPHLKSPGLLVMDMDSTAIDIECIDELARLAGCGDEVAAITEKAMRGELDFKQSLQLRVAALKGADEGILQQVLDDLPIMSGLELLVNQLQLHGWQIAIASGGFSFFAQALQQRFRLSAVVANILETSHGYLTGKLVGPIVDGKYKARTLEKLAQHYQIPLEQTVAIGDGANDILMLKTAGLGIAYRAKPKVTARSAMSIRFADLTGVLCILTASLNY